jgi:hypothetical protein
LPGLFGMLPVVKALVLHLGPTLHAVWCCAGAMVLGGPAAAESYNCGNHSLTVDLVLGSLHESLSCGSCFVPARRQSSWIAGQNCLVCLIRSLLSFATFAASFPLRLICRAFSLFLVSCARTLRCAHSLLLCEAFPVATFLSQLCCITWVVL